MLYSTTIKWNNYFCISIHVFTFFRMIICGIKNKARNVLNKKYQNVIFQNKEKIWFERSLIFPCIIKGCKKRMWYHKNCKTKKWLQNFVKPRTTETFKNNIEHQIWIYIKIHLCMENFISSSWGFWVLKNLIWFMAVLAL